MKIEKLPSGSYRARVYIGRDANGKTIHKSFTDTDRRRLMRTAAEFADRHREMLERSEIGTAVDDYIEAKTAILSPKTIAGYVSLSKTLKARYSAFCALRMEDINRKNMTQFVNNLITDGLTPKTIRNYVGLISAVLKHNGYIPPVVTLPKNERKRMTIPEESTIKRIMEVAPEDMQIPLTLAILGLRRSEICALTVDDLDENILHIHSAVVYDQNFKLVRKTTKTDESTRFVQIPDQTARQIREQGYVTNLTPDQISYRFRALLKRNDLPHYRLHDLRHFFASYCHTVLKLSDAQIQQLGGWKTDHVMKQFYRSSMNDRQAGMILANSVSTFMTTNVLTRDKKRPELKQSCEM